MDEVVIDKKFFEVSFPLLDKFKEIAPGTFKHCQTASIICESIAQELGMNVDLIRCAALYHDIGKMNYPKCFAENQNGSGNIHDELDPFVSYQLITRHVGDSLVRLLQVPDMPNEVLTIVSQHHGDTVMRMFFEKSPSENEDEFRYKCEKPASPEASILMIVDSAEAMVRAVVNNSKDENTNGLIKKSVDSIIDKLIDDNQLDNMKIGTLKVATRIIIKELETIYHKRVPYGNEDKTIGEAKEEGKVDG